MSDEIKDKNEINEENTPQEHSDYKPVNRFDASAVHHLSGMYQNWFLDYASYDPGASRTPYRRRIETRTATHPPLHEAHG